MQILGRKFPDSEKNRLSRAAYILVFRVSVVRDVLDVSMLRVPFNTEEERRAGAPAAAGPEEEVRDGPAVFGLDAAEHQGTVEDK